VQEPDLGGSGGRVLTREEAHGGALERWGLGGGRPEEQLVAVLEGSGRCTVLARRSLRWRRTTSIDEEECGRLGASMISYGG
jgi:hypothetical protein